MWRINRLPMRSILLAAILGGELLGQTTTQKPLSVTTSPYVSQSGVPSLVRDFLLAFGDRIQKPGSERTALAGTFTDNAGTVAAQLVWQLPGQWRLDRTSKTALVLTSAAGVANPAGIAQSDLETLESLTDDTAESFFSGFAQGYSHRFLGGRFRTDDGKTPNYQGPLYDIYEALAPAQSATGKPVRQKFYYFDSLTKLLMSTRYVILRGSTKVEVSTEFSKWTTNGGQAYPGQIVRKENGGAVFTFAISSASSGPSAKDGLFPSN